MKVYVRERAGQLFIAGLVSNRTVPNAKAERFSVILDAIAGRWVEVDTKHLFANQYTTVAIPGVTALGARVMERDILAVAGDHRPWRVWCAFCWGHFPGSTVGLPCPSCLANGHGERVLFEFRPMRTPSWAPVLYADDCEPCVACLDEPECPFHGGHYADCDCYGPTEDGVVYSDDGAWALVGTRDGDDPLTFDVRAIPQPDWAPGPDDRGGFR